VTAIKRDPRCIGNEIVEKGFGCGHRRAPLSSGRAEWALPRGCREAALRRLRGDGEDRRTIDRREPAPLT
jgi:hypothetical protein